MPPEELSTVLRGDSKRVEWKESAADAETLLHAVCALANDLGDSGAPGFPIIGIDARGQARGTNASDQAIRQLINRVTSTKSCPTRLQFGPAIPTP